MFDLTCQRAQVSSRRERRIGELRKEIKKLSDAIAEALDRDIDKARRLVAILKRRRSLLQQLEYHASVERASKPEGWKKAERRAREALKRKARELDRGHVG
jgi:vacuolar-type H+-ATPase subunit I/STV1